MFSVCLVLFLSIWSPDRIAPDAPQNAFFPGLIDGNRCGPNCVQFCLSLFGHATGRVDLEKLLPTRVTDYSLSELQVAAESHGCYTSAIRWSKVPGDLPGAAIIRTVRRDGRAHFVVLAARNDGRFLVVDVPHEPYWVPDSALHENFHWTGEALHICSNRCDQIELLLIMYELPLTIICGSTLLFVALRYRPRSRNALPPISPDTRV